MQITTTTFSSKEEAVNSAVNWRDAVRNVVEFIVASYNPESSDPEHDGCFSSGEVSQIIRKTAPPADPAYWHEVGLLGSHLSGLVWANFFFYDDGKGNPIPLLRYTRYTKGVSRTAPNTPVFLYCPTPEAGRDHEFETDIRDFSAAAAAIASDKPSAASRPPRPQKQAAKPKAKAQSQPSQNKQTAKQASVAKDGRMYISKSALELYRQTVLFPIPNDNTVYVDVDPKEKEVRVSFKAGAAGKGYQLWRTGRAAFTDRGEGLFEPGNVHPISIRNGQMVVDLTTTC